MHVPSAPRGSALGHGHVQVPWGPPPTAGGPQPPGSTVPTQATSSQPGTATVQLWLTLSLESQIPAVVWGNKCAERAEYLMGPLSARNDSGNEPPLSSGCQGLLLCLLATLPGAALPAGARCVPGRGMRYGGLRSLLRGEKAPWGWKWLMQHVLLHFVPVATKPALVQGAVSGGGVCCRGAALCWGAVGSACLRWGGEERGAAGGTPLLLGFCWALCLLYPSCPSLGAGGKCDPAGRAQGAPVLGNPARGMWGSATRAGGKVVSPASCRVAAWHGSGIWAGYKLARGWTCMGTVTGTVRCAVPVCWSRLQAGGVRTGSPELEAPGALSRQGCPRRLSLATFPDAPGAKGRFWGRIRCKARAWEGEGKAGAEGRDSAASLCRTARPKAVPGSGGTCRGSAPFASGACCSRSPSPICPLCLLLGMTQTRCEQLGGHG